MPSFDVRPPGRRPPWAGSAPSHGSYLVNPLPALGGVFAYVERGGEWIGLYFGETELAVTAAVAEGVLEDTGANA